MKTQIISFHCVLKNKLGKVISSTFNQDVLTGGDGTQQELMALAHGMQNLKKGEKRRIDLSAQEAYGFYDPAMVIKVARQDLPQIEEFQKSRKPLVLSHQGKPQIFRVVSIGDESILLDGNHPLAGQDLVFEIETTEVRDATKEEIDEANANEVEPAHVIHRETPRAALVSPLSPTLH